MAANPIAIPLTVSATAGASPTPPDTLRSTLITNVAAVDPGYTANLPGTLIEDIASTDVGAIATMDQARVDAVNNITPYLSSPWVLAQLGTQAGLAQGVPSNTSVYVVFTGPIGYVIPAGFTVTDGTYQYALTDGGVITSSGQSLPLLAVATQSGSWAVLAGTVTQLVTSVPTGYTLTVTNPNTGTPGASAESVQSYRSRVLQAGIVAAQGTAAFIKTLLPAIPGVQSQLVSVRQVTDGWVVICGGGDPYAVANAIYQGCIDLAGIVGSQTATRNVTVTLTDPPDQYQISFVSPPMQTVALAVTWNTNLRNFTDSAQVNTLGAAALLSYINAIPVGQPINELDMTSVFQSGISTVLPVANLTSLTFSVSINGVLTNPLSGTSMISSDPESYFYTSSANITVAQG